MTTFENQCAILAELWIDFRYDSKYTDFVAYNDLGLPLAYALDSGIVEKSDRAMNFIEETFELLLELVGVEDNEWETLDQIIG